MADSNGNGWRRLAFGAVSVLVAALGTLAWQGIENTRELARLEASLTALETIGAERHAVTDREIAALNRQVDLLRDRCK